MSSLIVVGSKDCKDKDLIFDAIDRAIKELDIIPREIVSGTSNGVEKIAEEYAKKNGLNIVKFQAKWDDISECDPSQVKERYNTWKKVNEKYNPKAGFERNDKMVEYAMSKDGALVTIDLGSNETKDIKGKALKVNMPIYEWSPEPIQPHEFGYNFWSNE